MIKEPEQKVREIVTTITSRIDEMNNRYRSGPDLYFYKRLMSLRTDAGGLATFLDSNYNLEIVYATLVSWDMNSRGAKMKYFDNFRASIFSCRDELVELSGYDTAAAVETQSFLDLLAEAYDKLDIMKTSSRLVSNSKLLHFMIPDILMPMDRNNTLAYFYGNQSESINKFLDIISLSFVIMKLPIEWDGFTDNGWNTTLPKMIDNAIMLLLGKSVR